ncbi:GNAT family N-acetyltransferase [Luteimonas abyssi]|uniref:GNAT family N-acetyltransferase n=1 Tax=Luteimonas abyssi TaxID=1247514 RepID=UPI000737B5F3|nr:GNAT family N-acetyltransferase [Luteimonas abyssi]
MAARNRLPPWHDQIRLANGRELLIRPVRPDDAEPLRAGFALLGPEEIRQRFVEPLPELTAEMADRLTRPDPKSEFALVAAEPLPPGEAVVGGVARVAVIPGTRDGQFTILVSRYIAGLGAGRQLMRRLVRWAKGKKLQRMVGEVQESNQPMLALAESLGFRREPSETPGTIRLILEL